MEPKTIRPILRKRANNCISQGDDSRVLRGRELTTFPVKVRKAKSSGIHGHLS